MYQLQTAASKVVASLGVIALVVVSHGAFYFYGQHTGKNIVRAAWNTEKAQYTLAIETKTGEYAKKRDALLLNIQQLEQKVKDNEQAHVKALAAVNDDYATRLRTHQERASLYQRAARGSEAKQRALADHAAELDRTVVEGRRLVGELRATLGLREQQIQRLNEERQHERNYIN